jgi:hypothetical protein
MSRISENVADWHSNNTLAVILRTLRVTHAARIENIASYELQRRCVLLMVNPWHVDGKLVELESSNSLALLYVEVNLPASFDHTVRVYTQRSNHVISLVVQSQDPLSRSMLLALEPPPDATHFFNRPLTR